MASCAAQVFARKDEGASLGCVKLIQRYVNGHLLSDSPLQVDGDFGPLTESAVKAFQTGAQIKTDGIVGPQTWAALQGPVFAVQGKVEAYSLIAPVELFGPNGSHSADAKMYSAPMTEDTGAYEVVLPANIASYLGLPHLKDVKVGGVNSAVMAYETLIDLKIGDRLLKGLHAVADPQTASFLLGFRFATRWGLEVRAGGRTGRLAYYVDVSDMVS